MPGLHHNRPLTDLTPSVKGSVLPEQRDSQLSALANDLCRQHGVEKERQELRAHMLDGEESASWAWLHADDYSGIRCIDAIVGVNGYPSRAFTRARGGDWVAGTFKPIGGYAEYMAERLQLGRPRYLQARVPAAAPPYAVFTALLEDEASLQKLAREAKSKGGLIIHPYMGLATVWKTAQAVSRKSGQPVKVVAPLPKVTGLANNKVAFLEMARRALGRESVIDSAAARTLKELVQAVKQLASRADEIVLRRSDSASGMATKHWRSKELGKPSSDAAREKVLAKWLRAVDWRQGLAPPIEVAVWEEALGSPSIQMWVPPASAGWPLCEGIFDQRFVAGAKTRIFEGSVPNQLPASVQDRLRDRGLQLGRVLQLMGYVGRCSFDTILCGPSVEKAQIKLAECNGRWGGTSTPMTFMNRLFRDYRRQPYAASDYVDQRLEGVDLAEFTSRLDDVLFDRAHGRGWLVVYNVGPLTSHGKLDVLTIGQTQTEASARQAELKKIIEERF